MAPISFLALLSFTTLSFALPAPPAPSPEPDPSFAHSAILGGDTYINKGLVAFGLIPANFKDATGDTFGGVGSAIALSKFKAHENKFTGTLIVQPDRGFNVDNTVDYQARHHRVDFELTPYYGVANLNPTTAQQTLKLDYKKTTLYDGPGVHVPTTGLDSLAVKPAKDGFPDLPIAATDYQHVSIDAEGIVLNKDGTFWMSDEYGPYIYRFSESGKMLHAIQPPPAILPYDSSGHLNFTASSKPTTGRNSNQGFEGLTYDPRTKTLYALLQSATIQDGGSSKQTNRFTRLLAYSLASHTPVLKGEWVVPLSQTSKGATLAQSEVIHLKDDVFMILARDANGHGGNDPTSAYKQADLFSIAGATDIHGTAFDSPSTPIAVGGVLDSKIIPATYVPFLSYLDPVQLARFGLHNGLPDDRTLLNAKWESFALASVGDERYPDDFFLFTASDNDFLTTDGVSVGKPYNAGLDADNQFLVFRVTLPGVRVELEE